MKCVFVMAGWFCVALVMWMLYFSHFFTSFSIGLRRICLCAEVRHLVFICSLLVGTDCVTDKYYWKLHPLECETHSFVLKFRWFIYYIHFLHLWCAQEPHLSNGIPGVYQTLSTSSGFVHCAGFTGRNMVDWKDQVSILNSFKQSQIVTTTSSTKIIQT